MGKLLMIKKDIKFTLNYLNFRNPIENSPEYRSSVLTMLPYLRSLDFAKGDMPPIYSLLINSS